MRLPKRLVALANAITNLAILIGVPRPPYTRRNAVVVETVGRHSGRVRRVPVGYLEQAGMLMVVVEDGARAQWIQNALARNGALRVHFRGRWRKAHIRFVDADPESYLQRMNAIHARFVRAHSTTPAVAAIELEQ